MRYLCRSSRTMRVRSRVSCLSYLTYLMRKRMSRSLHNHGKSKDKLYTRWCSMRQRCNDSNHKSYPRYGGRGISISKDWNNYLVFEEWALSSGYKSNLTLDRRNNDLNYGPDNCRWVTRLENLRNTRRSPDIEFNGKSQCLPAWADDIGCTPNALRYRFASGWSKERALTTPSQRPKKHNKA